MKPIANWRVVLRRAWSVRLMVIAAIFSAAEFALPYLEHVLPVPTGVFAGLCAIASFGGIISRFIAQENIDHE